LIVKAGNEFAYQTAGNLIAALLAKRISAVELLDLAIARIEMLDPCINAVVVRDFERARECAKAADASLARGGRDPLLGIPITVKESYDVAGLPTTWGLPSFKNWRPNEDAVAVSRLKKAGAILLGKTNVATSLIDFQTYNDLYGTTNNPWDLGCTPGGTSGGSAASLAAGYVSLELASDVGGSLRAPAHFCGVFSHVPTYGLVPHRGHQTPRSPVLPSWIDLAVTGPMARSASDLALALDILAGPDELTDGIAYRLVLPQPRHTKLSDFRVLVIDTHPLLPTASTIRAALEKLAGRLANAGSKVARSSPLLPDLAETARMFAKLLHSMLSTNLAADVYEQRKEAEKSLRPEDDSLAAWRTRGTVLNHRDWMLTNYARARLRQQWREFFREWDVVLCPPMPTPAFAHNQTPNLNARHLGIDGSPYPYLDHRVWMSVATTSGLPATFAPIDHSDTGLPIGVQIIGPYLEDRSTIAFAKLIEREFGGFVPPPELEKQPAKLSGMSHV
jgi:amidase